MSHSLERFFKYVKGGEENSCWIWAGAKTKTGYGQFSFNGKPVKAHRFMYETYYGVSPGTLDVCHSCDNPLCINPKHLWLGTAKDNLQDASKKERFPGQQRVHCIKGHVLVRTSSGECKVCKKEYQANYYYTKKYGKKK